MPLSLAHVASFVLPTLPPGHALAPGERRTLESVVEVFLHSAPVPALTAARATANIERFLLVGRSRRAWRVRALLTLIELSTLPVERRRFSRLSLHDRTAVVKGRWSHGRHVNRIFGKIRNLAILGIYGDTRAATATGYVPVTLRPRFRDHCELVAMDAK